MNKKSALRLLAVLLAVSLLPVFSAQALADDAFFCRKCGKAIPADSNFCPYCGEAVIVLPTPTADTEPKEDKSVTDAIIAELIASIRTAASENSRPASAAAAAAPAAEPETTEPGPFQTVRTGNSLVYNEKVRVTKSPTSESVPYGGSAIFIARADYDTSITWYCQ